MSNPTRTRFIARANGLLRALWRWSRATCSARGVYIACQTVCGYLVYLSERTHGLLSTICLVAAFLAQLGSNGVVIWICLDVRAERYRPYIGRLIRLLALLVLVAELVFSAWLVWVGLHHVW